MKIRKINVCNECGIRFDPPLSKKLLAYQKKYMWNEYVRVCCDSCIEKGHTITDSELRGMKKTYIN